jgi:hypothetical protein
LIKNHFDCEYRGKINAKGKGDLDMYFVLDHVGVCILDDKRTYSMSPIGQKRPFEF